MCSALWSSKQLKTDNNGSVGPGTGPRELGLRVRVPGSVVGATDRSRSAEVRDSFKLNQGGLWGGLLLLRCRDKCLRGNLQGRVNGFVLLSTSG